MSSPRGDGKASADVSHNGRHTNGAESPPPPPPVRDMEEESSDSFREAPQDKSPLNEATTHHQNDSNNNSKPSEDSARSQESLKEETSLCKNHEDSKSAQEDRTASSVNVDTLKREQEDEDEGVTDVESTVVVRPKPSLEDMPKSSFASELINNIRNSRHLLCNSHNELSDAIAGKNKEVSGKDRFFGFLKTTTPAHPHV